VALFAIGLAAGVAIGLLISYIWDLAVIDGVGLSVGVIGAVLLATGGASGGGYRRMHLDSQEGARISPRAEVNPKAMRQVASGFAYLGIGLGLSLMFG